MKITSFEIKNYKGINEATIDINGTKGSIYTLVGLNESGKTTILEAINNFRPDVDGVHVMAQKTLPPAPIESLIPKKDKDSFNKDISIAAYVKMSTAEIQSLAKDCKENEEFEINVDTFPREFKIERTHHFLNSEHTKTVTYWSLYPHIKKKGSLEFVTVPASEPEWQTVARKVGELLPRIVYFPTFLFDFPERIQIIGGESKIEGNEHFKLMIEDALGSLDDDTTLKTHIVDRILKVEPNAPSSEWVAKWSQSHEKESVEATLSRLSRKISTEIFGRWQEVLGTSLGSKEVVIGIDPVVGDNDERTAYLSFRIKDGYDYFKVSERSLGFQWFFCFLLFTQSFGGTAKRESIFLFDEPASNLHSKAQSKLLESLKDIAADKNDIIYSTHSHYLINPDWLEATFIVTNGDLTDEGKIADADAGVETADIRAIPYRRFVGQNAEKSHYFQPILDRLNVAPSMLDATRKGLLTEGKSDFYILNWYKKHHDNSVNIDFIPIGGADNAGPLMSLYRGLCSDFVLLLDGDAKGISAKADYLKKLPISDNHIILLTDVFGDQIEKIEDLLSDTMKQVINNKYSPPEIREDQIDSKTEKGYIKMAFSEALSGKNDLPADPETLANLKKLCDELKRRLPDHPSIPARQSKAPQ